MGRFMSLFEKKEKTELAKTIKTKAQAKKIREQLGPLSVHSPTVTIGSHTVPNPCYIPLETSSRSSRRHSAPVFKSGDLETWSEATERRAVSQPTHRDRRSQIYTIDEEPEVITSNPFADAESVGDVSRFRMAESDHSADAFETWRCVTAEHLPRLTSSVKHTHFPVQIEIVQQEEDWCQMQMPFASTPGPQTLRAASAVFAPSTEMVIAANRERRTVSEEEFHLIMGQCRGDGVDYLHVKIPPVRMDVSV